MNRNRFEKRWLQAYAADVSKEDIEKYVIATGKYIWHVFSWNLLPKDSYLTGDSARAAYDVVDKTEAVCLKPFSQEGSRPLPKELTTAHALDGLTEVYVVGKDYTWTYIKTHENDHCGPYFMEIKKTE